MVDKIENEIESLKNTIHIQEKKIQDLQSSIQSIYNSRAWKVIRIMRDFSPINLYRKILWVASRCIRCFREEGFDGLLAAIKKKLGYDGLLNKHKEIGEINSLLVSHESYDIAFVVGCTSGESKRYRVYNFQEGLSNLGILSISTSVSELLLLCRKNIFFKTIVIFRFVYNKEIEEILQYAKKIGCKVAFDVDDLIFEPESIHYVNAVTLMSPAEQAGYLEGVKGYENLLLAADYVTCATDFLAKRAERLGKAAYVIPNSINSAQMKLAEMLIEKRQKMLPTNRIVIGYFSGSNTHQEDFSTCESALLHIMENNKQCELLIVGYLNLSDSWQAYSNRIKKIPFQPYLKMLEILSEIDINIAPLKLNNPYCNSKSQLKIFEAGLVQVPTIASPTVSYMEAIEHGIDGFLADTKEDWMNCFELLINSSELRGKIGNEARKRALKQYGLSTIMESFCRVHHLREETATPLISAVENNISSSSLKISWIIPGLIIESGGHRNILRMAYYLQTFGHDISLYFTDTGLTPQDLAEKITEHFYPLICPITVYQGEIKPCDVLLATHWTTVNLALKAKNKVKEVIYFVQDFEPFFYPIGTGYVLAENTYRQGLYHITSGPWCENMLRRNLKAEADHFLFPIDSNIYFPRQSKRDKKSILFFARPEMPRRCFELGLMVLEIVHQLNREIEIILFGSNLLREKRFPFAATIMSIIPTVEDLAELYSSADLGMVFSTTNPSLVPYEMMACGLPVVDIDRADNSLNYGGRDDIVFLANPFPDIMAKQICSLLENTEELNNRRKRGIEFVKKFPTELESAKKVEILIQQRVFSGIELAEKNVWPLTAAC